MLLKWRVTSLFSSLSENARGLLLLSMPATPLATLCARNPETALDQSVNSQAPSLTSYATASSGLFPGLLAPRGTAGQKRNRRKKKTAHLTDTLSEETKSREYKAFEAFIAANCSTLYSYNHVPSDSLSSLSSQLHWPFLHNWTPLISLDKKILYCSMWSLLPCRPSTPTRRVSPFIISA